MNGNIRDSSGLFSRKFDSNTISTLATKPSPATAKTEESRPSRAKMCFGS